ncbi:MAG: DNA mismatch repair endonuclease MutL [Chitinispirillales bacterium]|jgi:DNA mismatch repair protein MutL|nr:DNA mismatch repair endonuclease MutL [Chitinispirillales bacterium]
MPQIKLLPKNVVEQIAAGEVIERPSSIVKELLENAIDSGADKISVFFENGGISKIKVTDNGCGIEKDQLLLALTPHATSKINSAQDLYAVSTMGFRGEALASVASASKMTLTSSVSNDGAGYKIFSNGGDFSQVEPVAHLKGTSVECRDLFFNLPVRKKFLKSENSEKLSILSTVEDIFTAFPTIHFTCIADGKKIYDVPAVQDHKTRISQIAGINFANDLIYCGNENPEMSAQIYICSPSGAKPRPKYQNLYVNLRKIDNGAIAGAIRESFSRFISAYGNKPSWFCFLDIEPSKIDVNVHPTKQTVKFDDEKSLFSFIFRTVFNELETYQKNTINPVQNLQYSSETPKEKIAFEESQNCKYKLIENPKFDENVKKPQQISMPFMSLIPAETVDDKFAEIGLNANSWDTVPCFQIHNRYVAVSVADGLLLIDQHAAHERILYEKILDGMEKGIESQSLIFPVTMELKPFEKEIILSVRDFFSKAGFDIKDFGKNTVAIYSMPTDFSRESQIKEAIEDIAAQFIHENNSAILSSVHRHFAASYACGAAIKFGHTLKNQEMNALLTALFSTKNPHICPHGRPTFSKISLNEIAKRFLR